MGKEINHADSLTIYVQDYAGQFNVERSTAYQVLKNACNEMFARELTFHPMNENGNLQVHKSCWLTQIIHIDNEALVSINFSPAIIPLLAQLKTQFD